MGSANNNASVQLDVRPRALDLQLKQQEDAEGTAFPEIVTEEEKEARKDYVFQAYHAYSVFMGRLKDDSRCLATFVETDALNRRGKLFHKFMIDGFEEEGEPGTLEDFIPSSIEFRGLIRASSLKGFLNIALSTHPDE